MFVLSLYGTKRECTSFIVSFIAFSRTYPSIYTSNLIDSLSLFPVALTLGRTASVKRFVSLQFLNRNTVGRIPWTGDQPVARPLTAHRTTQIE
jgi:hypothetical protein